MHNPVLLPTITKSIEQFGNEDRSKVYKVLQKAQFKNAISIHDKINL